MQIKTALQILRPAHINICKFKFPYITSGRQKGPHIIIL